MGFSALDETMPAVRKCEENLTGQNRSAAVIVGGGAEPGRELVLHHAILFFVLPQPPAVSRNERNNGSGLYNHTPFESAFNADSNGVWL